MMSENAVLRVAQIPSRRLGEKDINLLSNALEQQTMSYGLRILLVCATLFVPCWARAQTNAGPQYDPLEAFVGTWTATNTNETAPYMVLTLKERDGKLDGTMNHFSLRVVGSTLVGGQQMPGEFPISDPTVSDGVLWFTWTVNSPFQDCQAKFVVQGTQVAQLIFMVSKDSMEKIMAKNPTANGLNPVISLSRKLELAVGKPVSGKAGTTQPPTSQKWEIQFMARLINTAEVQYKAAHGHYADYLTLLRSGQLKETGTQNFTLLPGNLRNLTRESIGPESDPLPGYSFRLVLSADKNSYQVLMREKTTGMCGYDVFTDETGIISEAHPLGCPITSR
jgi:hypothetical protein